MAITYDSGTNIITITGYTEAVPCNFTDIYNADVAGSWGVVTRQCTNQFCINCKIVIGNGSTVTWLASEEEHLIFTSAPINECIIYIDANAHLRFGKLEGGKRTSKGSSILYTYNAYSGMRGNTGSYLELYSSNLVSTLNRFHMGWISNFTMFNNVFGHNIELATLQCTYLDIYNLNLQKSSYGINYPRGTWDKILFSDVVNNIYIATSPNTMVFKNITMLNNTYLAYINNSVTNDLYLINPIVDNWTISWNGTSSKVVYRQYEFDLTVVDIAGSGVDTAKVKIWDVGDHIVTNTTTNASGVLATQTLNYGYYNQSGGNTPVMQTPHEMRIYEYGKNMLSSKSSIEAKTDWALTMYSDPYITQTTEATVAAYTGITINHTTETVTISSNHTLDEIYDYCQYDIIASTKQLDQTMRTSDGVNFVSEYSFVVNTGITVTATDQKLSMVSGETYTLTGTAQFTGILVDPATTINKQISLGTDDAWESNNSNLTITGVAGYVGYSGFQCDLCLRWQSIDIAQGTTINSAKLSVYQTADTGTLSANIRGIDEDNTVTWASDDRPSQRTKTTATITANEASWNNWGVGNWIDIDITSVIQEIVDRAGWSANNALAVVIEDSSGTGNNYLCVQMYEYAGNLHGAKLDIVYEQMTTRIPVKLTNVIDGSRYWVGKSSDGSEIFKGTQSGSGDVIGYYEHTANIDIDIRVRKSSASVKYLPWAGDGTLIAAAFSLRIRQIQDNIVT